MTVDAHGIPVPGMDETQLGDPGRRGRDVYVKMDRLFQTEAAVTEFFDDEQQSRFLTCTCRQYKETGLICDHIGLVYGQRLDIYEIPEDGVGAYPTDTGEAVQRVALPFELGDDGYTPLVTILGNEYKLAVRCGLFPLNDNPRYVRACVFAPNQDDPMTGSWIDIGILPREAGRGELRIAFVEWSMEQIELHDPPAVCNAPWHEAWEVAREGYGERRKREQKIVDHWMLFTRGTCYSCLVNSDVPETYNPLEGVLRRVRSDRQQSRSRANNPDAARPF